MKDIFLKHQLAVLSLLLICAATSFYGNFFKFAVPITYAQAPAATSVTTSGTDPILFIDVPPDHRQYIAIKQLKEEGIIQGYKDGTFKPNAPITRAETVAILLKVAGIKIDTLSEEEKIKSTSPFSDVSGNHWFFPMIKKSLALKKIKGFEDGTFKPLNPVTLTEAFALSFSFLNIDTRQTNVEGMIYEGLDPKAWYGSTLQYAKNMFILTPTLLENFSKGRFDPLYQISRGEFAEIVQRSRLARNQGTALDITANWTTSESQENYWRLRHPASWGVFKGTAYSVLWNKKPYSAFFTRLWPTGVRLSISVVENENKLSSIAYFDILKREYSDEYGTNNVLFFSETLEGRGSFKIIVPKSRIIDVYIHVPNEKFLILYGEYGSAPIGEYLKKELELVMASYHYIEPPKVEPKPVIPLQERLERMREKILIEGGWNEIKDFFEDKKLIHTDGIGIGTGPVDYFFTQEGNYTIKIERSSSTILNAKETQTTAF